MKTPTMLLLLAVAGSVVAAESPDRPAAAGTVTMPLEEVLDLVAKSTLRPAPRPEPPIPFAVTDSRWNLRLAQATPIAEAKIEVEVFAGGWNVVPLVRTALALRRSGERKEPVVVRDGMLCLLADGPGRRALDLEFEVPGACVRPGGDAIGFHLPPGAGGEVAVDSAPPNLRAVVAVSGAASADGRASIPAGGGDVVVRIVDGTPSRPTEWSGNVQAVVAQRAGWFEHDCRVRLRGRGGNGLDAVLELPGDAEGVVVTGADLVPIPAKPEGESMLARLRWETPDILAREVAVRYRTPLPESGESWVVRLPAIEGDEGGDAKTVVVAAPEFAMSGEDGRVVNDASEWPAFAAASATDAPAFVTTKRTFEVLVRRLARVEVDTSRIPSARLETRIVPDGAMLSNAAFTIQHRGPMRWRFALPAGAELLSCEVDGKPFSPLALESGDLELAVHGGEAGERRSEIRLSFTGRLGRVEPIEGRIALSATFQPAGSSIEVAVAYEPKPKGLMWYRTYRVDFRGEYRIENPAPIAQTIHVRFHLPSGGSELERVVFELGDGADAVTATSPVDGALTQAIVIPAGGSAPLRVAYRTRGRDVWTYALRNTGRLGDFHLRMATDFREIDFPAGTSSPSSRELNAKNGWDLRWEYDDVIDPRAIGMSMPKVLNAGPVAARISFFAPVSLLFFFAVLLILGAAKGASLHPMNYFFLAAGFFAFQLLFAYLVDHLDVHLSFAIAAAVSVGLVCGYLQLVAGRKLLTIALPAQLAFMVLFGYSFFFDGVTGLTITIGAIVTLAMLMAVSARVDWGEKFRRDRPEPASVV